MNAYHKIFVGIAIVLFAVLSQLGCGVRSFAPSTDLIEFIDSLQSFEELQEFLGQCRYIAERGDYWKTPEEFFQDHGGDCEDFAYFTGYVFLRKGWTMQAWVIIIRGRFYGKWSTHATTLLQDGNEYYAVDYGVRYPNSQNMLEAVRWLAGWEDVQIIRREEIVTPAPLNACPLEGCP